MRCTIGSTCLAVQRAVYKGSPRPSGAERRKRSRERADARTVGGPEPTVADLTAATDRKIPGAATAVADRFDEAAAPLVERRVPELDRAPEGEGSAPVRRTNIPPILETARWDRPRSAAGRELQNAAPTL